MTAPTTSATHLYIVTGASSGLGLAMAGQLLRPGHRLLCISRRADAALEQSARDRAAQLEQWRADLSDAAATAARLADWLAGLTQAGLGGATLINNAALLPPPVPLRDARAADTAAALRVGLEAPMLLTSAFLGATRDWAVPRKVLNISSGLARRPMASQAAYCALKAGLEMFTRCAALDEALLPNGARLSAVAPGVVDTDMQRQLRSADAAAFPDVDHFARMHAAGSLRTAADAAGAVLAYLQQPDFGAQVQANA